MIPIGVKDVDKTLEVTLTHKSNKRFRLFRKKNEYIEREQIIFTVSIKNISNQPTNAGILTFQLHFEGARETSNMVDIKYPQLNPNEIYNDVFHATAVISGFCRVFPYTLEHTGPGLPTSFSINWNQPPELTHFFVTDLRVFYARITICIAIIGIVLGVLWALLSYV